MSLLSRLPGLARHVNPHLRRLTGTLPPLALPTGSAGIRRPRRLSRMSLPVRFHQFAQ
jgi:hypothetical protein